MTRSFSNSPLNDPRRPAAVSAGAGMSKGFRLAVAALALFGAAACGGESFQPGELGAVRVEAGDDIQIRSMQAISGDFAALGLTNQRGMELGVRDYGPIMGRAVNIGPGLDSLCSPDGGQAVAQQVAAEPQVAGVIGTSCSSAATAASPLISAAGLVMIASSNTSPALTSDLAGSSGPAWNKGYYRTSHNDLHQGRAVADFVKNQLGLTTAAVIHDGDTYTQGLASAFADSFTALGGEVTIVTGINKGDADMTPVLTEVAATRPQALFIPIFPPEGGFIAQQMGGVAGLEETVLIGSAALLVDNHMEIPETEGMYLAGPDLRFEANRNQVTGRTAVGLLEAYQAEFGEPPPGPYWAHSYDAAVMLLSAIESAAVERDGSLWIDRAAVREALDAADFEGVTGRVSCDEFGDCGVGTIAVILHSDSADLEASRNNVVFSYAPER